MRAMEEGVLGFLRFFVGEGAPARLGFIGFFFSLPRACEGGYMGCVARGATAAVS